MFICVHCLNMFESIPQCCRRIKHAWAGKKQILLQENSFPKDAASQIPLFLAGRHWVNTMRFFPAKDGATKRDSIRNGLKADSIIF